MAHVKVLHERLLNDLLPIGLDAFHVLLSRVLLDDLQDAYALAILTAHGRRCHRLIEEAILMVVLHHAIPRDEIDSVEHLLPRAEALQLLWQRPLVLPYLRPEHLLMRSLLRLLMIVVESLGQLEALVAEDVAQ